MTNDELDLLAFRFIADELSDDEREAFELRLAEDQAAREAVARAVELSQATMAAFESLSEPATGPVAPREAGSPWYTRIVWMTSGAVACLVALIGYHLVSTQPGDNPVQPEANPEVARAAKAELANAWSDAQESVREMEQSKIESEDSPDFVATSSVPEVNPAAISDPAIGDMGETPSWMLAAIGVEESDEEDGSSEVPNPANGIDQ